MPATDLCHYATSRMNLCRAVVSCYGILILFVFECNDSISTTETCTKSSGGDETDSKSLLATSDSQVTKVIRANANSERGETRRGLSRSSALTTKSVAFSPFEQFEPNFHCHLARVRSTRPSTLRKMLPNATKRGVAGNLRLFCLIFFKNDFSRLLRCKSARRLNFDWFSANLSELQITFEASAFAFVFTFAHCSDLHFDFSQISFARANPLSLHCVGPSHCVQYSTFMQSIPKEIILHAYVTIYALILGFAWKLNCRHISFPFLTNSAEADARFGFGVCLICDCDHLWHLPLRSVKTAMQLQNAYSLFTEMLKF